MLQHIKNATSGILARASRGRKSGRNDDSGNSQLSFLESWPEQAAPTKERPSGPVHFRARTGEARTLFDWLFEQPQRPAWLTQSASSGFDEAEVDFLREMLLWDALQCLFGGKGNSEFRENIEWVQSEDDGPFSFEVCAASCGVDPSDLRKEVIGSLIRQLQSKPGLSRAELEFLQDITVQRHLDVLSHAKQGSGSYEASLKWLAADNPRDLLSLAACAKGIGMEPDTFRSQVNDIITRREHGKCSVA